MSEQSSQKFESTIPQHLLDGETKAMQFLMNELSRNSQATEYLLKKREESGEILGKISDKLEHQNKELAEIVLQTKRTNGTVLRHTQEIAELVKNKEDLEQIVAIKKVGFKLMTSKIFWIILAATLFYGVSTGFFFSLLKWAFGSIGLS